MTETPPPNGSYAALEQRVSGIEGQISALVGSVDALARDMREGRRIPWGAVAAAIAATGLLGSIVLFGFMAYINQTNEALGRLSTNQAAFVENVIPKSQLDERYAQHELRLSRIEDGLVTRGEHQSRWDNQQAAVDDIQRQIDLIRSDLGSSYSLNDALKTMQERLERLEGLRLQQTVPLPSSPVR